MELVQFAIQKILGDELNFAGLVIPCSPTRLDYGQIGPVDLMNHLFQFRLKIRIFGIRMGRIDQIINSAKKVSAITRTHQLLRGPRFGLTVVERHAALTIA